MKKKSKHIIILLIVIIAINFISSLAFKRFDLTSDKRYTLSEASLNIIDKSNAPIVIDVFLKGDGFPAEFKRLQNETKQLLEEFSAHNSNIKFQFINPLEDETSQEQNIQQLTQRGLTPMQLSVQENGKSTQEIIFPWATAFYKNDSINIQLIKNKIGASQQDLVSNSVQHLEYAFSDGFSKLINSKKKKIAILKGNGELDDRYIFDAVKKLSEYYFIAPFTLDSIAVNAQKSLKELSAFDLIIAAKPKKAG